MLRKILLKIFSQVVTFCLIAWGVMYTWNTLFAPPRASYFTAGVLTAVILVLTGQIKIEVKFR